MARRELSSEIEINATPELLWQILTDFGSYPEWNPFIVEIAGTPARDAKIRVCVQPPDGTKIQFRPRVLAAEANRELRWLGRVWFPGLLDGEHTLTLEPLDGGGTRVRQHDQLKGVLVGLFHKTLDRTQIGFERMNEALKQRAERP